GMLQRDVREFLSAVDPECQGVFWDVYLSSRWLLSIETIRSGFESSSDLGPLGVIAALQAIRNVAQQIPDEPDENPFSLVSKGFLARDCTFFLTSAAQTIRRAVFEVARWNSAQLQRDDLRGMWRRPEEVAAEFRLLFQDATDEAEAREWLSA